MRLIVLCEVHTEAKDSVFITDTECVLCEVWGEAEETVQVRASNIIKCKRRVSTCKKYQLCISALTISHGWWTANTLLRFGEILQCVKMLYFFLSVQAYIKRAVDPYNLPWRHRALDGVGG